MNSSNEVSILIFLPKHLASISGFEWLLASLFQKFDSEYLLGAFKIGLDSNLGILKCFDDSLFKQRQQNGKKAPKQYLLSTVNYFCFKEGAGR